jgi:hypothetical protein
MESELSSLMVDAQFSRNGIILTLFNVTISGTTFTYTTIITSFERNDSGNYTCTANVGSNSSYLYGNTSESINISIGELENQIFVGSNFCGWPVFKIFMV